MPGDDAALMTLRVSRDGGRTYGPPRAVRRDGPVVILANPVSCPPRECPRCTPERQATRAVSARSLRPA
ncbi:hypothetical protein BLA24_27855 [Streptomyces cinnamoneus]|uniref:Exo-alpha-sialidase n=1 Tax=Streptomyces cinnamoneus TaxID=53446 RepID=A0A2G1XCQ0_STRCJ|nr:hypothetical protein BLA24_27855 [Streptomyces cinnamoneus]PPT16631.1 hypothetical protein CYQ11_17785 [Streptomyces cinnamoneus]